ncbi:endonuclease I [Haloactinopolyspora alba]|uniref:Endonuclease I n=1 Tax=Haloactinopolyspora alba TaxID=648780 RepID=A0A2P8DVR1_9ACTN|nr:endonuclease [Haloactinopolyspora alba]PSL01294.1 endonuclease I [Haloactinopolyspora alba]
MPSALLKRSVPIVLTVGAAVASVVVLDPDPREPDESVLPTEPPADYYSGAMGLSGDELAAALHEIVSDSTAVTYDEVWAALRATDEHPDDPSAVRLFYSGRPRDDDANGGSAGDWNREHVWPKSHGDLGTAPGPGTDLHHLRPTDVAVNAERGNKDFDDGGSAVPEAPGSYTDDDSWEPRDEVKGDVARAVFYMAVRYEGGDGFADLEVNDRVGNGSEPFTGRLDVLREWHRQDPPDADERRRNDVIFEDWQHNRNPFVDHPAWVDDIWG